ncbi:MAG: hypothetical protein WD063_00245 [Pirellulales bacterium]
MTAILRVGFAWTLAGLAALAAVAALPTRAAACPFCSAVSLTFSEEIGNSQIAVIARLIQAPPRSDDANSLEAAKAKFEITKVLKGEEALGKTRQIEAVYFGDSPVGTTFLMMGIDPPAINWSTPIAISERGVKYVTEAMDLPKEGADRLAYFQDYLEDGDDMLARDAYDEFAKAPYSDVLGLRDRMKHDKLVAWVKSTEIPVSRRRLYITMMGAQGNKDDVALLEEMIKSKDRQTKGALDALVAAYLTLKGPDGMPLVEELFLKNNDAEYTDTYATIMALRFHGTEDKIIPRERLLAGLRMMLDRPQLADLVIPDLARWEDWSVMDKLVELFKTSNEESSWVRVPVINYLRACPLPAAKQRIDELAKIDPESIKRANSFFPLGAAPVAATAGANKPAENQTDKKADSQTGASEPAAAAGASSQSPAETAAGQDAPATSTDENKTSKGPAAPASVEPSAGKPAAILSGRPAEDSAAPGPPASSLPVFGGLAAAAVLLGCAFWAILKGGQRAPG